MYDAFSYNEQCRNMVLNEQEFLITEVGTTDEDKIRLGVNCNGFGRIRLFERNKDTDWISNPLPFNPYAVVMGGGKVDTLAVQVFQIAKCNLNCWWCFLPDKYKNCSIRHTKWFTVDDLLDLYYYETKGRVKVIDISGGNPELVPEFILQFMNGIEKRNLTNEIYLWSDDVLTTDFMFTKLKKSQVQFMSEYKNYGKVACFKGIDEESFRFNTCSTLSDFNTQLIMTKKYIDAGFDIYFYIVLTVPDMNNIRSKISAFFDKLQQISYYLPLRIVPIKIKKYTNNEQRIDSFRELSISNQFEVLSVWREEISKRYSSFEIERDIALQPLKHKK